MFMFALLPHPFIIALQAICTEDVNVVKIKESAEIAVSQTLLARLQLFKGTTVLPLGKAAIQ